MVQYKPHLYEQYLPVAQLDSASDSDSEGRRFESYRVGQKSVDKNRRIFLYIAKQWYIIAARRVVHIVSSFGAVYHHASTCIFCRLDYIQCCLASDEKDVIKYLLCDNAFSCVRMRYPAIVKVPHRFLFLPCRRSLGWLLLTENYCLLFQSVCHTH